MVKVNSSKYLFDDARFNDFCNKYEFSFPASYLDYLKKYNDGLLEPNVIGGSDNGCYVRYFYGTSEESYSDLASVYEWYIGRMPHKCVPVADADFGNQICISLAPDTYGKIYFWDHETMDTEEDEECVLRFDDMVLLADSFDELLDKIEDSPY